MFHLDEMLDILIDLDILGPLKDLGVLALEVVNGVLLSDYLVLKVWLPLGPKVLVVELRHHIVFLKLLNSVLILVVEVVLALF